MNLFELVEEVPLSAFRDANVHNQKFQLSEENIFI